MRLKMRFKPLIVVLCTIIMLLQGAVFGLAAFAEGGKGTGGGTGGGKNLPLITECGVYSYDPGSNTTPPGPIGEKLTAAPWKLTRVPYVFDENVAIGIKFATNVAVDARFSKNQNVFQLLDASNKSVGIKVSRAGDGTPSDKNRNYLFVAPQFPLQPSSSYKIIVGPALTSNNGMSAGVQQEVDFTTASGKPAPAPANSTTGSAMVNPAGGGTVGLGGDAKVVIPANALNGADPVAVSVRKADTPPAAPADAKKAGDVFECTVGGKSAYTFAKNVTLTLGFNPAVVDAGESPAIFAYDEAAGKWVNLGGAVAGSDISAQVNHFAKFAVFAVAKASSPGTFSDTAGNWAEASIKKLVELKVTSGYPDGSFKPDATITRAEFATMLVKAFNLAPQSGKIFSDTRNHWAKDNIATAVSHGIAGGYDEDTFGPDDLITREQMAAMIVKAARLTTLYSQGTSFADSADISPWATGDVAVAVRNGVISGYPGNTFLPQGQATRAEAATVIMNALKLPR
ncbi:S-layer homology domain-containing protein [Pelotomaculum isophthalicicum JI]|uniref:S-layer homology domain-containing protein n=1 Tax=Pelotomaculum isophthalicicum JI TaxID=947010 RepID=A0A9X4H7I0_9FIRM|nr:S-layer homology domain-containing protein [Pelotomaculum isophthalicicum]MDF9409524.1 S-layer homology domain-containing protein [Pelotomaculum isophthalicicum JI]